MRIQVSHVSGFFASVVFSAVDMAQAPIVTIQNKWKLRTEYSYDERYHVYSQIVVVSSFESWTLAGGV
jgi:hypothetical protein